MSPVSGRCLVTAGLHRNLSHLVAMLPRNYSHLVVCLGGNDLGQREPNKIHGDMEQLIKAVSYHISGPSYAATKVCYCSI